MTKEEYLSNYRSLIKEVRENKETYSENDWINNDKKFNQFNGDLYKKFENELNWEDQLMITQLKARYNLYRYKEDAKDILSDILGTTFEINNNVREELKRELQYYIDNQMEEDANFLIEQTRKAGGTLSKVLDEVLDEIGYKRK
jgi:hypothetical protein